MSRWIALLALLLAGLTTAGCATRGGKIAYGQTDFRAPDPAPAAVGNAAYRLSPGDVVTVRVLELESLSGDQTVDGNGQVTFPLIGGVPADGRTIAEFQTDIGQRLQRDYLQSPHVVATLKAAAARTVTVDGAVKQPGVYPIVPDATLIQAVALAQGTSNAANPRRVVVFRQIGGLRRAAAFDLTTIRNGSDPDPRIYASDTIVVDGSTLNEGYRSLLRTVPLIGLLTRF